MKKLISIIPVMMIGISSFGQMIMTAEGVHPDNACNPDAVYFLIENRARPLEPVDSIEMKLNRIVTFAKDHPDFKGEPAIQFVVNCRGGIGGGFHMVKSSGNDELDRALIAFFKTVNGWQAGKKSRKKTVDSWYMWRLEIKEGYIDILN